MGGGTFRRTCVGWARIAACTSRNATSIDRNVGSHQAPSSSRWSLWPVLCGAIDNSGSFAADARAAGLASRRVDQAGQGGAARVIMGDDRVREVQWWQAAPTTKPSRSHPWARAHCKAIRRSPKARRYLGQSRPRRENPDRRGSKCRKRSTRKVPSASRTWPAAFMLLVMPGIPSAIASDLNALVAFIVPAYTAMNFAVVCAPHDPVFLSQTS